MSDRPALDLPSGVKRHPQLVQKLEHEAQRLRDWIEHREGWKKSAKALQDAAHRLIDATIDARNAIGDVLCASPLAHADVRSPDIDQSRAQFMTQYEVFSEQDRQDMLLGTNLFRAQHVLNGMHQRCVELLKAHPVQAHRPSRAIECDSLVRILDALHKYRLPKDCVDRTKQEVFNSVGATLPSDEAIRAFRRREKQWNAARESRKKLLEKSA